MQVTKVAIEDTSFVNLGRKPSRPNTNTWAFVDPLTGELHNFVRFPESKMLEYYVHYNWDRLTQADPEGYRRRVQTRCKHLRLHN